MTARTWPVLLGALGSTGCPYITDAEFEERISQTCPLAGPEGDVDLDAAALALVADTGAIPATMVDCITKGTTAAPVGDVNADGYDDVAVSVGWSAGMPGEECGEAYDAVFFIPGAAEPRFEAAAAPASINELLSSATVHPLGDTTGDGLDDFVVVGVFNGHPGFAAFAAPVSGALAEGGVVSNEYRQAVDATSAGGWSRDGEPLSDLAVGSPVWSQAVADELEGGAVYVYFSPLPFGTDASMDTDSNADATILGGSANPSFGTTIEAGVDLDGDGRGELLVSAPAGHAPDEAWGPFETTNCGVVPEGDTEGAGVVYRFEEVDEDPADAGLVFGVQGGDCLGFSLSAGADIDGDGYQDLFVGAPFAGAGEVWLIGGGAARATPATDADAYAILVGGADGELAGWSVVAPDEGADGPNRVVAVGAPGARDGEGGVYVLTSIDPGVTSLTAADGFLEGPEGVQRTGEVLASAGDVNADGLGDLLVGAPAHPLTEMVGGGAWLLLGACE